MTPAQRNELVYAVHRAAHETFAPDSYSIVTLSTPEQSDRVLVKMKLELMVAVDSDATLDDIKRTFERLRDKVGHTDDL